MAHRYYYYTSNVNEKSPYRQIVILRKTNEPKVQSKVLNHAVLLSFFVLSTNLPVRCNQACYLLHDIHSTLNRSWERWIDRFGLIGCYSQMANTRILDFFFLTKRSSHCQYWPHFNSRFPFMVIFGEVKHPFLMGF